MSVCKRIQSFCNIFENYGQNELDIMDFNRSKDFPNYEFNGANISPQILYASSYLLGDSTQEAFDLKDFVNQSKVADHLELFMN